MDRPPKPARAKAAPHTPHLTPHTSNLKPDMKLLRYLFWILLLVAMFALGIFVSRSFDFGWEKEEQKDSTVLLEKIKTVAKLVTVEGYFSELYNYKDYVGYDWWIFRKKAILRVQAKVSVGYDLSNLELDVRPDENLLIVRNIPSDPEIISIQHDIDYYDLSEGTFNYFDEKDYTQLNKDARDFIEAKAKESELMDKAREQGVQILDVIRFMAENAGYRVEFQSPRGQLYELQPDSLLLND